MQLSKAPLWLALGLAACATDPTPAGDGAPEPAIVDFADACTAENDGAELQVVGYADAFPRALSCSEGDGEQRLCPVDFYADRASVLDPNERTAAADSADALAIYVPEGDAPNNADATGYGVGPVLTLVADDGTRADPYDRLSVTGRFSADAAASGGTALLCAFEEVRRVEIVEPASPGWGEAARDQSQDAFLDSLNAERSQVE